MKLFLIIFFTSTCLTNARFLRQLSSCPRQPDSNECRRNHHKDPIRCGPSYSCTFDNACYAEAAGFNTDYCQFVNPLCPAPAGGNTCPRNIDPVVCEDRFGDAHCQYDNACIAHASGLPKNKCQFVEPLCPAPGNNACPYIMDPVECQDRMGGYCKYNNECLAQASGFVGCKLLNCDVPGDNMCPRDINPVRCNVGSSYCEYDNECLANAAGHVGCVPVNL